MIVRSRPVPGQAAALVHAGVERAQREIEARLDQAQAAGRSAGIAESAQRVAEAERRAAAAEKRAGEAVRAARAEIERDLAPALAAVAAAAQRTADLERQLAQSAEAECVRIALAVAARVLRREVETDSAWMTGLVQAALREIPDRRGVAIRLCPQDAAALRSMLPQIAATVPGLERVELEDDPRLPRGGCVLMSQGTRLDASVAGSWERVAAAILDAAPQPPLAVREDGSAHEPPPGGAP